MNTQASVFEPTLPSAYSTLRFIGRRKELEQIENAIRDKNQSYFFYVTAPGGVGKTRLLREVINRLRNAPKDFPSLAFTTRIVDFYDPALHNPEGLTTELVDALQVDMGHFDNFITANVELETARREQKEDVAKKRMALAQAFISDFNRLTAERRIVILLDTAEMLLYESQEVQEVLEEIARPEDATLIGIAVRRWLVEDFLPKVRNAVVVLAGRPQLRPRLPGDLERAAQNNGAASFVHVSLDNFEEPDTLEYFDALAEASRAMGDERTARSIERNIPPETRRVIHLYTGGNPILLGLLVDYLVRADALVPDIRAPLAEAQKQDLPAVRQRLKQSIVNLIQNAGEPEDEAIRTLAWARKGMDAVLLAKVSRMSEADAKTSLEHLRHLSFVKEHPSNPNLFFLHDEMYALLRRYVLDPLGPERRQQVYRAIREHYRQQITQTEALLADAPRETAWRFRLNLRTLTVEHVHYYLREDPHEGFFEFYERSEEAFLANSDDFDMQLRSELLAFWQEEEQHAGHPLDEVRGLRRVDINTDSAIRWVKRYISHGSYDKALRLAKALRTVHTELLPDKLAEAELSAWEALAISYIGGRLDEPERLLTDAAVVLSHAESRDKYQRDRSELVLAQVHNRLGYLYDGKGQYSLAIESYRAALPVWHKHNAEADLANTLNNLAFDYAQIGNFDAALRACEKGLNIRDRLGFRSSVGYSLNTLGLIQIKNDQASRAITVIQQALAIFEELRGEGVRGVGLANIALAEAKRRACSIPLQYTLEEQADLLWQAVEHAKAALEIFPSKEPEKRRQVEAFIELGCAYRDWAKLRRAHPAPAEKAEEEGSTILANLAASALNRAAEEAHGSLSNMEVDALANLAWSQYWVGQSNEALATADKIEELIPEEYRLKKDKGIPTEKGAIGTYYVQLGKCYNLRGQIALDAGGWEAAAQYFTLTLAHDECFAKDSRDIRRAKIQVGERLDKLTPSQVAVFHQAVLQTERDFILPPPSLMQTLISETFGNAEDYGGGGK